MLYIFCQKYKLQLNNDNVTVKNVANMQIYQPKNLDNNVCFIKEGKLQFPFNVRLAIQTDEVTLFCIQNKNVKDVDYLHINYDAINPRVILIDQLPLKKHINDSYITSRIIGEQIFRKLLISPSIKCIQYVDNRIILLLSAFIHKRPAYIKCSYFPNTHKLLLRVLRLPNQVNPLNNPQEDTNMPLNTHITLPVRNHNNIVLRLNNNQQLIYRHNWSLAVDDNVFVLTNNTIKDNDNILGSYVKKPIMTQFMISVPKSLPELMNKRLSANDELQIFMESFFKLCVSMNPEINKIILSSMEMELKIDTLIKIAIQQTNLKLISFELIQADFVIYETITNLVKAIYHALSDTKNTYTSSMLQAQYQYIINNFNFGNYKLQINRQCSIELSLSKGVYGIKLNENLCYVGESDGSRNIILKATINTIAKETELDYMLYSNIHKSHIFVTKNFKTTAMVIQDDRIKFSKFHTNYKKHLSRVETYDNLFQLFLKVPFLYITQKYYTFNVLTQVHILQSNNCRYMISCDQNNYFSKAVNFISKYSYKIAPIKTLREATTFTNEDLVFFSINSVLFKNNWIYTIILENDDKSLALYFVEVVDGKKIFTPIKNPYPAL